MHVYIRENHKNKVGENEELNITQTETKNKKNKTRKTRNVMGLLDRLKSYLVNKNNVCIV